MNIWLEIFGYVGMALVLLSMMMTNTKKLRTINLAGAVVCMIYGAMTRTWPTAFLNLGLAIIQIVQLIRMKKQNS
jgi:hypothetical protein